MNSTETPLEYVRIEIEEISVIMCYYTTHTYIFDFLASWEIPLLEKSSSSETTIIEIPVTAAGKFSHLLCTWGKIHLKPRFPNLKSYIDTYILQYMLLYIYMLEYKPTYNIYRTGWSPEKKKKQLSIRAWWINPRGAESTTSDGIWRSGPLPKWKVIFLTKWQTSSRLHVFLLKKKLT